MFITTGAYVIMLNMNLPLGRSMFTKITHIQLFIFQNKLISTKDVTLICDSVKYGHSFGLIDIQKIKHTQQINFHKRRHFDNTFLQLIHLKL